MENSSILEPWKILIVDDEVDIHTVTVMTLKRLVFNERPLNFIHAYSAAEGVLQLIAHPDTAIVLLDVVMEKDQSGLDLVKTIRGVMHNQTIRLLLRTGNPGEAPEESVILDYDIDNYLNKANLTAQNLRTAVITALRSYQSLITITGLHDEIDYTQKELIYALGEIAESRSIDTGHHVKRVGLISAFIADQLGLSLECPNIHLAASMHDLGKLAIDDQILNKPERLTPEEFEIIKNHCLFGYEILNNSNRPLLKSAARIAYEHHENFDGTGYPKGLSGDDIHICSRIVALVDVFDALATKRVYKDIWPQQDILDYLKSQRGLKFDPQVVDVFFEHLEEIYELIKAYS